MSMNNLKLSDADLLDLRNALREIQLSPGDTFAAIKRDHPKLDDVLFAIEWQHCGLDDYAG